MILDLLVDNDVLIKLACYSLLAELPKSTEDFASVGVLGSAPFVAPRRLAKDGLINDRESALRSLREFLSSATVLEPTEDELTLASEIEDTAVVMGLELDSGESQLCAIAIYRQAVFILTGDKRAIAGAERIREEIPALDPLSGRIVCLEQAIMGMVSRLGIEMVRSKICAEAKVDKSLAICLRCIFGVSVPVSVEGLSSYISSMRQEASSLLYAEEML